MPKPQPRTAIERLARLYGVQTSYRDTLAQRRRASPGTLLAVLRSLGANMESFDNVDEAIACRQQEILSQAIEPVAVAWDGAAGEIEVTLPAHATGQIAAKFEESADGSHASYRCDDLVSVAEVDTRLGRFVTRRFPLLANLPSGYHPLTMETPAGSFRSLVISAPRHMPTDLAEWSDADDTGPGKPRPAKAPRREWGGFLPLYSLGGDRNWGAGDFTDLEGLASWLGQMGGGVVGTLPLLAAYLSDPCEPSPYSPASRLFWNEFYIDVERIDELQHCQAARDLLQSTASAHEIDSLRSADLVEYRRLMAIKRRVLGLLAESFFGRPSAELAACQAYAAEHGSLEAYARFRATAERHGTSWEQWPQRLRDGELRQEDYDERVRRYHLFVQWIARQQLRRVGDRAAGSGCALYLDLPLGVRTDGYDAWHYRQSFAAQVTGGCPPDSVFTKGQNWQFAPLHPEALRRDGYRYLRDCLEQHLTICQRLRVDHVMGWHRLYWIPQGMPADQGVYVRYHSDELYAVASLTA
ncbi:MAG: 4-alpha-glucanotransferase, partial [Pirellulales bacterium]